MVWNRIKIAIHRHERLDFRLKKKKKHLKEKGIHMGRTRGPCGPFHLRNGKGQRCALQAQTHFSTRKSLRAPRAGPLPTAPPELTTLPGKDRSSRRTHGTNERKAAIECGYLPGHGQRCPEHYNGPPATPCALLGQWVPSHWPDPYPDIRGLMWAGPPRASFPSASAKSKACRTEVPAQESLVPWGRAGSKEGWMNNTPSLSHLQVVLRHFLIQDCPTAILHSFPPPSTPKEPQLN